MKKFTCHRDGTVSFFNGYDWERSKNIPSNIWRTFSREEALRANTTINKISRAEQNELRRDRCTELEAARKDYAAMSQFERDAHDNL